MVCLQQPRLHPFSLNSGGESYVHLIMRRYGMVLRQCAHFYNTIGSQMIESQKPMMLADALEFEKVCRRTAPVASSVLLQGHTYRVTGNACRTQTNASQHTGNNCLNRCCGATHAGFWRGVRDTHLIAKQFATINVWIAGADSPTGCPGQGDHLAQHCSAGWLREAPE